MVLDLSVLWGNYWISHPREEHTRILLVGDSVFRQIRSSMEYMSDYYVDFYATSYSIFDNEYLQQLDFFLSNTTINIKYDRIIFMENHHSYDVKVNECINRYKDVIKKIQKCLERYTNCTWVSSTLFNPLSKKGSLNDEIMFRNDIVKCFLGDKFVNLDTNDYVYSDEVHYSERYNIDFSVKLLNLCNYSVVWKKAPNILTSFMNFEDEVFIFGRDSNASIIKEELEHRGLRASWGGDKLFSSNKSRVPILIIGYDNLAKETLKNSGFSCFIILDSYFMAWKLFSGMYAVGNDNLLEN